MRNDQSGLLQSQLPHNFTLWVTTVLFACLQPPSLDEMAGGMMTGGAYPQDPHDGMGGYPQHSSQGSMHGGSHQDINRHGKWCHHKHYSDDLRQV